MLKELSSAGDEVEANGAIRGDPDRRRQGILGGRRYRAPGGMQANEFGQGARASVTVFRSSGNAAHALIAAANLGRARRRPELAAAADIRIAERHVKIGLPETPLGMVPDGRHAAAGQGSSVIVAVWCLAAKCLRQRPTPTGWSTRGQTGGALNGAIGNMRPYIAMRALTALRFQTHARCRLTVRQRRCRRDALHSGRQDWRSQGRCRCVLGQTSGRIQGRMVMTILVAPKTLADLKVREFKMLIDGEWITGAQGRTLERVAPSHGVVVSRYQAATKVDAERAIGVARKAFDSGIWSGMTGAQRSSVLLKAADLISERAEELAYLDAIEAGNPISQVRAEIAGSVDIWRYAAALARDLHGESYLITRLVTAHWAWCCAKQSASFRSSRRGTSLPIIVGQKLPFALAAGCTCVVKPSELTSGLTLVLGEILIDAGVPAGVVNILVGTGRTSARRVTRIQTSTWCPSPAPPASAS